jgi:hypothetical protein
MWISKRADYATRAVLALTLADASEPVKLEEIARRTAVPQSVLEQIMPTLQVRDATIKTLAGTTFADLAKRAGGPWRDPELIG